MIKLELHCDCCGQVYLSKDEVINLIQCGIILGITCRAKGNEASIVRSDTDQVIPLTDIEFDWRTRDVYNRHTGQHFYDMDE